MNEAITLRIKGRTPSKTLNLSRGWNLAGFNSVSPMMIDQALSSVDGNVTAVYAFVNGNYKGYALPSLRDLTSFEPGYGYWVYATADVKWIIP
jgi:hypothetical protein